MSFVEVKWTRPGDSPFVAVNQFGDSILPVTKPRVGFSALIPRDGGALEPLMRRGREVRTWRSLDGVQAFVGAYREAGKAPPP